MISPLRRGSSEGLTAALICPWIESYYPFSGSEPGSPPCGLLLGRHRRVDAGLRYLVKCVFPCQQATIRYTTNRPHSYLTSFTRWAFRSMFCLNNSNCRACDWYTSPLVTTMTMCLYSWGRQRCLRYRFTCERKSLLMNQDNCSPIISELLCCDDGFNDREESFGRQQMDISSMARWLCAVYQVRGLS